MPSVQTLLRRGGMRLDLIICMSMSNLSAWLEKTRIFVKWTCGSSKQVKVLHLHFLNCNLCG